MNDFLPESVDVFQVKIWKLAQAGRGWSLSLSARYSLLLGGAVMVACVSSEFGLQHHFEDLGEHDACDAVLADCDSLEDGLVHLAPGLVRCGLVGLSDLRCEFQCRFEVGDHYLMVVVRSCELTLHGIEFCGDALLFALHQAERYRIGVVSLEELLSLVE